MRLAFFQYGDFSEAYSRLKSGGEETYRDQRSSVEFVANLASAHEIVVISVCDRAYTQTLSKNLLAVGISTDESFDKNYIVALLTELSPEAIVLRTPNLNVLRFCSKHKIPTLPVLADIFLVRSFRNLLQNARLRLAFDHRVSPCIANHSLNASVSVARCLAWPKTKIVPWDWSKLQPNQLSKEQISEPHITRILYCGHLTQEKGFREVAEAVKLIVDLGIDCILTAIGSGDIPFWKTFCQNLGVLENVQFTGSISNSSVKQEMKKNDIVIVPSRHEYPEGLPNTIYEALASRTPLIISDHPAFKGRLVDEEEVLVFQAGNSKSLADCILKLRNSQSLYCKLSENSLVGHDRLYCGINFDHLIGLYIDDLFNELGWVEANSLAAIADRQNLKCQ